MSSGSSHSPVCTGEGWITVLDGATSQWKRSDCSSARDRAGRRVARGDPRIASRCARTSSRSSSGANAREPRLVERDPRREVAPRAAEQHDADVHALAALDPRDDAHDRVLERAHAACRATLGLLAAARSASRRAGTSTYGRAPVAPTSQSAGHGADDRARSPRGVEHAAPGARRPRRSSPRSAAARGRAIARERPRAHRASGPSRGGGSTAPRRGRSATAARARTSRFGLRGVRSTFVTSASSQTIVGGELRRRAGSPPPGCTAASRAGSRAPTLTPAAARDQLLDLRVRLGARPARDRGRPARSPAPAARAPAPARRRRSRPRAPCGPCPAPRNLRTYSPSSSASTSPGSEPPSRSGRDITRGGHGSQARHGREACHPPPRAHAPLPGGCECADAGSTRTRRSGWGIDDHANRHRPAVSRPGLPDPRHARRRRAGAARSARSLHRARRRGPVRARRRIARASPSPRSSAPALAAWRASDARAARWPPATRSASSRALAAAGVLDARRRPRARRRCAAG